MSTNLSHYKTIIFDLGGVILNIDYDATVRAFQKLGLPGFEELFSKAKQKQLFDLYEKGNISSDEFRKDLQQYLHSETTAADIDSAWNAMLLDLPEARLKLLSKLKSSHRTFLLSNTNEIHMMEFERYLQGTFKMPDLTGHFEKVYLSYKMGMRKPDAEIFEHVLNENKLDPTETLFIDDSPQHLEGAKKLDIQTYWLDVKKESILELF